MEVEWTSCRDWGGVAAYGNGRQGGGAASRIIASHRTGDDLDPGADMVVFVHEHCICREARLDLLCTYTSKFTTNNPAHAIATIMYVWMAPSLRKKCSLQQENTDPAKCDVPAEVCLEALDVILVLV